VEEILRQVSDATVAAEQDILVDDLDLGEESEE
jgi:hypothetical protein